MSQEIQSKFKTLHEISQGQQLSFILILPVTFNFVKFIILQTLFA